MRTSSDRSYRLEIAGQAHELDAKSFRLALCDLVSTLLAEKEITRASFVFAAPESGLGELSASLYRHLKQQRCVGPPYSELGGGAHSFRLHSLVDALVATHFYCHAGDEVPHFFVGNGPTDILSCLERGTTTRVAVENPPLLSKLRAVIGGI